MSLVLSNEKNPFIVGAEAHPDMLDIKEVKDIKVPLLLLVSSDEINGTTHIDDLYHRFQDFKLKIQGSMDNMGSAISNFKSVVPSSSQKIDHRFKQRRKQMEESMKAQEKEMNESAKNKERSKEEAIKEKRRRNLEEKIEALNKNMRDYKDKIDLEVKSITEAVLAANSELAAGIKTDNEGLQGPEIIEFCDPVHGWMAARANLDSLGGRQDFEIGYEMVLDFWAKHWPETEKPIQSQ